MLKTMAVVFASLLLALCTVSRLSAYEPPSTPIQNAVASGKVAIVGRITQIREIAYSESVSEAELTLEVLAVLYGIDAAPGDRVNVRYASRWFQDTDRPGFGMDFLVSSVVLLVFNSPQPIPPSPLLFNSTYKGGIDLAYVFRDEPGWMFSLAREFQYAGSAYGETWSGKFKTSEIMEPSRHR